MYLLSNKKKSTPSKEEGLENDSACLSQELQGVTGELLWSNAMGFFSQQINGVGMCLRREFQRSTVC